MSGAVGGAIGGAVGAAAARAAGHAHEATLRVYRGDAAGGEEV